MQVLLTPKRKSSAWFLIKTCKGCHSHLKLSRRDVRRTVLRKRTPRGVYRRESFFVRCGHCKGKVTIPEQQLPETVIAAARKRSVKSARQA